MDVYSLAGCLVEDEDVARAKNCASKAEELLLAVGEVDLVDVCVQVSSFLDGGEEMHGLECSQDVLVAANTGWVGIQPNTALE